MVDRSKTVARSLSFRWSVVLAAAGLGVYGLTRFLFNILSAHVFGPAFLGVLNPALSTNAILALLVAAPFYLTVSKFTSEHLAKDDLTRADEVFSVTGLATAVLSSAILGAVRFLVPEHPYALLDFYIPAFALYFFLKGALFAYGYKRAYAILELLASTALFLVFGLAIATRSEYLAACSLLVHPVLFSAGGTCLLASHLTYRLVSTTLGELVGYARFHVASTLNTIAGLGAFHFIIVLAKLLLNDPVSVGYLSVLLAGLSPLNLLPAALTVAFFPEMAFRHGANDQQGQRRLVALAFEGLLVLVLPAGIFLLLGWPLVFPLLNVPLDPTIRVTWALLIPAVMAAVISSPCGHFLNATRFAGLMARVSVSLFGLSVLAGLLLFPAVGIVAGGVMRVIGAGLLGAVRIYLAEAKLGWREELSKHAAWAPVMFLILVILAAEGAGWLLRAIAGLISLALLVPVVMHLVNALGLRHSGSPTRAIATR